MEDGWEQGEAGGKETSQEAVVVIQARNDESSLPCEHAAGMESERWMWETLDRRGLCMWRVRNGEDVSQRFRAWGSDVRNRKGKGSRDGGEGQRARGLHGAGAPPGIPPPGPTHCVALSQGHTGSGQVKPRVDRARRWDRR